MEFISDDYQHPYLHHRNVLNPYTSAYAHPDYLGAESDFVQDEDPSSCIHDDEESGGQSRMRALMEDEEGDVSDYINTNTSSSSILNQNRLKDDGEDISPPQARGSDHQGEDYSVGDEQNPGEHFSEPLGKKKARDDYNPKTDGKKTGRVGGGGAASRLEEKLTSRLEQLKAVFNKRFHKFSEFCSWNCFFSLLFVVGVLLVFLDHYGSAYVRMMNMQKFFFFVMGVLTTTVAVVVVCVVVAFTSCYGDGF